MTIRWGWSSFVGWVMLVGFAVAGTGLSAEPREGPSLTALDATELEPVVVTADRRETPLKDTPEIIVVVTEKEIRRMNPSSTGEILDMVAGLNVETGTGSGYPKRSVVSINGLPAQYTLVLVNGQRLLTEHIHTGQNVDMIPPESIERIELIKTAASAQYGSDAIGGVVNIITKKSASRTSSKVYGTYGSNRSVNTGVGLSAQVAKGVQVSMFADWDRTDGVDILAPKHRLNNMGYERVSVLNNIQIQPNRFLTIDTCFNYFQNKMDWSSGPIYSRLIMPKTDLHVDFNKQWRLTGSLEYTSWRSDLSSERNELLHPHLYTTWKAWKNRNELTFGGDYRFNWFRRTGLDRTRTQGAYGFFAHDRLKVNTQWSVSASARLDQVEGIDPVFSPKVAVLYRPIEELGIRAAVGRGYHAPTLQELYEQAYGHGGTALRFGNPDLKPETSTAFSLSLETVPVKSLQLFVNGYFHLVDNFIAPAYEGPWEEDPTKDKWIRTNIVQAWLYGAEATAIWSPLVWLRLRAGYSYSGNRDKAEEKQLQFHPGQSVFGQLDLRFVFATHYALHLFAKTSYRAGRTAWSWKPAADAPRDSEEGFITNLEDYVLLDAGLEFTFKHRYTFYFNATNILAEDIEHLDDALTKLDGEPLFRGGLRFKF
jgi:outer membrane receptor protein involved in Fe transport